MKIWAVIFICELGGIRTPNLQSRNLVHYPVMLRVLIAEKYNLFILTFFNYIISTSKP